MQMFKLWKPYRRKFNEKLKERFSKTCKFSNHDNKFILLLPEVFVYPYQYMDDREKFNETSLPEKGEFDNNLNMKDITDVDYTQAKGVSKDFEINFFGKYHYLYSQNDILLLADVSENFRNTCLEIYELDPAKFLSAPGLAWQAALKKTKVKLKLLTDINILLMVGEGMIEEIYRSVYRYAEADDKCMKDFDKNKESSYVQY